MTADLITALSVIAASIGIGALLEYIGHAWHVDHGKKN